ncbi:hypothetical protein ACLOJK_007424 [Asimina triloba]
MLKGTSSSTPSWLVRLQPPGPHGDVERSSTLKGPPAITLHHRTWENFHHRPSCHCAKGRNRCKRSFPLSFLSPNFIASDFSLAHLRPLSLLPHLSRPSIEVCLLILHLALRRSIDPTPSLSLSLTLGLSLSPDLFLSLSPSTDLLCQHLSLSIFLSPSPRYYLDPVQMDLDGCG